MFAGAKAPRPPSFNEADVSDKPAALSSLSLLTPAQITAIDSEHQTRLESLQSVDESSLARCDNSRLAACMVAKMDLVMRVRLFDGRPASEVKNMVERSDDARYEIITSAHYNHHRLDPSLCSIDFGLLCIPPDKCIRATLDPVLVAELSAYGYDQTPVRIKGEGIGWRLVATETLDELLRRVEALTTDPIYYLPDDVLEVRFVGRLKFGWLGRLNDSSRNCTAMDSAHHRTAPATSS
jgi:hypothetical protein